MPVTVLSPCDPAGRHQQLPDRMRARAAVGLRSPMRRGYVLAADRESALALAKPGCVTRSAERDESAQRSYFTGETADCPAAQGPRHGQPQAGLPQRRSSAVLIGLAASAAVSLRCERTMVSTVRVTIAIVNHKL